jgi:hypothetical protein
MMDAFLHPRRSAESFERAIARESKYDRMCPDRRALADLIGTINSSLRNHAGKGVQRTNEGSPARWRLKEAGN